jgi:hypothetical protein
MLPPPLPPLPQPLTLVVVPPVWVVALMLLLAIVEPQVVVAVGLLMLVGVTYLMGVLTSAHVWLWEVSQMRDITWVAILMVVAYFAGRGMAYLIRFLP